MVLLINHLNQRKNSGCFWLWHSGSDLWHLATLRGLDLSVLIKQQQSNCDCVSNFLLNNNYKCFIFYCFSLWLDIADFKCLASDVSVLWPATAIRQVDAKWCKKKRPSCLLKFYLQHFKDILNFNYNSILNLLFSGHHC